MEIPREKGVDKAKLLKKPMELNWNFQRKRERGGGEYAGVLLEAGPPPKTAAYFVRINLSMPPILSRYSSNDENKFTRLPPALVSSDSYLKKNK